MAARLHALFPQKYHPRGRDRPRSVAIVAPEPTRHNATNQQPIIAAHTHTRTSTSLTTQAQTLTTTSATSAPSTHWLPNPYYSTCTRHQLLPEHRTDPTRSAIKHPSVALPTPTYATVPQPFSHPTCSPLAIPTQLLSTSLATHYIHAQSGKLRPALHAE